MKQIEEAKEVLARLERFAALERKATDEAGWIAVAFSCSRTVATNKILRARKLRAEGKV